jgi:hypothetical protein
MMGRFVVAGMALSDRIPQSALADDAEEAKDRI